MIFHAGIHRPYFANSNVTNMREAGDQYRKMMSEVRAYLEEMNMPDILFQEMQSVPPEEMKYISFVSSGNEMKRLLLFGEDPAWQEKNFAVRAQKLGISTLEMRGRQAIGNKKCAGLSGNLYYCHIVFEYGGSALLTADKSIALGKLISREIVENCRRPWPNKCTRVIADKYLADFALRPRHSDPLIKSKPWHRFQK